MELTGTVWSVLKASPPNAGAAAEALNPYRAILADYARGKGLSAEDIEAGVQKTLRTLSDPSFLTGVDPAQVRFRPLLHALLTQAIRKPRGWSSMNEKEEAAVLEVSSRADDDFDRLWRLHLFRTAAAELARESPVLARTLTMVHEEGIAPDKIWGQTGRDARADLAEAESRLKVLLERAVHGYTVLADQFAAEMKVLAAAPGVGWMHETARKLLAPATEEGSPGVSAPRFRFRIGMTGFVSVVLLSATVVAWTSCDLRREREARARERDEESIVKQAELALERSATFVYEGGDASRHQKELRQAIDALRRLRPTSTMLARGLALQVGVAEDPALFKEAMSGIGARPEAAALAWEHWVYRAIRKAAWGEPAEGKPPAESRGPRFDAEFALLKGEDERALDLYMELQLVRPGDPVVWLGGALAALRAGSPSVGARFARRASELLDLGESHPREGQAVALALEGLCLERLGREDERAAALKSAARKAGGNPYARALASRAPASSSPAPPDLPRSSSHTLVFEALGEPAPAALEASLELIRLRLQAAEPLVQSEARWDADSRRLLVTLGGSTAKSVRSAEWLVVRRGVFSSRDLAPRSLNDQWRHPSRPAGNDWAPINLFYPDLPKVAGRYRLLKQEIPLLAREDLEMRYDASEGRLTWACRREAAMPAGAGVALLLDGEIFWYGRVEESRSGFLVVAPTDPQTLIPFLFGHGPLPVQFARRG